MLTTLRAHPVVLAVVAAGVAALCYLLVLAAGHRAGGGHPRPASPANVFPSALTTGVPKGTTLLAVPGQVSHGPGWYFDPRGFVQVDGDGAVLSGLYIPYNLDITGSDVTIRDVRVVAGGPNVIGISLRHTSDVTIKDCTTSGRDTRAGRLMAGIKDVFGDSASTMILRDDISMFESGVQLETGLIQGSYIHDPGYLPGDHTNGVTSNGGGTRRLTITGNTILVDRAQTDAIGLFEDFGGQQNRIITGNLLAGGGYTVYAGQNPGGPPSRDIVITGNQISSRYYPRGGFYGCVTDIGMRKYGNIWSENTWNTQGTAAFSRCN
ncbi:MAG TPA: hypothetical protein VNF47_15290 [Streptosporangiaceae bacterium]|nr:hypothetical protein [Streptosporangiaceae bacterium]